MYEGNKIINVPLKMNGKGKEIFASVIIEYSSNWVLIYFI